MKVIDIAIEWPKVDMAILLKEKVWEHALRTEIEPHCEVGAGDLA